MTPQESTAQGERLYLAGRLQEAEACYAAALALQPDYHPALHLMGLLRYQLNDHAGALVALDKAAAAAPASYHQWAALHATRGELLFLLGQDTEALAAFEQALARDTGLATAWNNHGMALNRLGRPEEALASFAHAARLAPQSAQPLSNQGDMLRQLRRFDEALACFSRALAMEPGNIAALVNRGGLLTNLGHTDEAIADYTAALSRHPDIPEALFGRSHLFTKKSDIKGALADLEHLLKIAPDYPFARGNLMRLNMMAAAWDDFPAQKALIDAGVRAGKKVIVPLNYLGLSDSPEDIHHCAQLYAQANFPARPPLHAKGQRRPGRIRIGYVCGEFRTQATLYLMVGQFEAHDRESFEIFAFDNGGGDGSALRQRFEKAVEHIIDITYLSDGDAAARIAAEDIDILVDLNGYTGEQRLNVFALKPAPLQVCYLVWPGTLGAPYMDYIIADKAVIPESHEGDYSEKIAWLPHSFQINDRQRAIGPTPSRAEAGLPAEGFVFCNFNHAEKRSPQAFACWMRILAAIPGSVLWLPRPHELAAENLKRQAQRHGVAAERLIFAPHTPTIEDYLGRLKLADLFLDAFPYCAHTVASDALWAGLPLLTLASGAFAGRVAASLLLALGLPELVTHSEEEFETAALTLARQPETLAAIREKLAAARTTAPLFDTVRTTRAIERAYRTMFENRARPPESFTVPD